MQRCTALLFARNKKQPFSLKKFSSLLLATTGNCRSVEICIDELNMLSVAEANCLVCPIQTTKHFWPSE